MKSMSKYDKMIEENRKKSEEKVRTAVIAIHEMVADKEKVTIPKLMKKTGLSRGFFYKNSVVRREVDKALEQQVGMIDPRRQIIDQAMVKEVENRPAVSLKTSPELAELLRQQHSDVRPSRHLNKAHWSTVYLDGSLPDSQIYYLVDASYQQAVNLLPEEKRKLLVQL